MSDRELKDRAANFVDEISDRDDLSCRYFDWSGPGGDRDLIGLFVEFAQRLSQPTE